MSKKDSHDIDFFRGNRSLDELEQAKKESLNDTYTYSDFKFNKNKNSFEQEQRRQEELLAKQKADELKRAQYNRMRNEQMQKKLDEQNQQKAMKELNKQFEDENIASGKRKPLKPVQSKDNYNLNGGGNLNNKKKKKRTLKPLLIILSIILLLLIGLISYLLIIKNTAKPLNIVIIGVDQRTNQKETEIRADAIMNVSVGSKDNKIIMASIPRDTYTYIPCESTNDKITHAYAYGAANWADKGGGVGCTVKSVNGLIDTTSDRYVRLNFDQMVGIIDALNGIDLKATSTFCEQNSKGKKNSYCFESGKTYHMDGEMALAYARHRKSDDDIQRGLRQQEVFKAMLKRAKDANILEMPSIYLKITSMLETNLTQQEMLQAAIVYATKGSSQNFKFDWEGQYIGGVSYVKLSELSLNKYKEIIKQLK